MVEYGPAHLSDLPALAELFQQAFPDALLAVFGRKHIPAQAVEDVFRGVYEFEPRGFMVARDNSRICGFILVTQDLDRLRTYFLKKGPLFKMLRNELMGKYRGLGLAFIPRLLKAWWDYRSGDKHPDEEKPMAQELSIVVDPAYRGKGIGKELSREALDYLRASPARSIRLEVDAAKKVPINLYKSIGFVEKATIPSPRGPALVMTMKLK